MNIFYKLKKVQIKQIKDKVSLALRKCNVKDKKLTVGDVLSGNVVQDLIQHNEEYELSVDLLLIGKEQKKMIFDDKTTWYSNMVLLIFDR